MLCVGVKCDLRPILTRVLIVVACGGSWWLGLPMMSARWGGLRTWPRGRRFDAMSSSEIVGQVASTSWPTGRLYKTLYLPSCLAT